MILWWILEIKFAKSIDEKKLQKFLASKFSHYKKHIGAEQYCLLVTQSILSQTFTILNTSCYFISSCNHRFLYTKMSSSKVNNKPQHKTFIRQLLDNANLCFYTSKLNLSYKV